MSIVAIPKILHQTWRSGALPSQLSSYCDSWKRLNPDFEYRFYDDKACLRFVEDEFSSYQGVYEALPHAVQRADFFRYLVVYRFGGLYADIDMECLKPMARFFYFPRAVFSIEASITYSHQTKLGYIFPYQIANCIFAAPPHHPFLLSVIENVARRSKNASHAISNIEDLTGPRMLTRHFYAMRPDDVDVLHQIFWLPSLFYPNIFPLNKNMYSRHHFLGSWKDAAYSKKSLRQRWTERDVPPNPFPQAAFHEFFSQENARRQFLQSGDES